MNVVPSEAFVPPFPPRPNQSLSAWQRIRLGQPNFIAAFEEGAFEIEFAAIRILTQSLFICNSPETVQYVFSTRNSSFERKSATTRHMLEPLIGDGLFISDGETWQKRRRIVAPIVHTSRLSEFAPVMTDSASEMGRRWAALPEGATIDALSEMAHLTAEIICRTVFGRNLSHDSAREVVVGFSEFQDAANRIDYMSLLGLPDWLPRPRRRSMYRAVGRIHGVIDEIVESYRGQADVDSTSVVGRLMVARDPDTGERLDNKAIRNEAVVMFLAGEETTANTMAFAWYLLSQAPYAEARLHRELDEVLSGRPPTLEDVPKLAYTRAVIEETLRLYPPIPILAREALVDETIKGHTVRKGSMVLAIPWLLHRHRKLWYRPDHFLPERFLPGSGEPHSKWCYLPFSIGPRTCAGWAFGLTEAILCLATLAQRFSLELADGHKVEPICRVTLRPGNELPMTLRRRSL